MSRRQAEHGAALGLALKALSAGAEHVSPGHLRWDISCRCKSPVPVDVGHSGTDLIGRNQLIWVEMQVRCRKCSNCLRVRSWEWAHRATVEVAAHPRSYFGTLTLSPEWQYKAQALGWTRYAERFDAISELNADEVWQLKVAAIGTWITRYIKRVRKDLGIPLRYLLVAEAHKSGDPHFHMLLHEVERATPDQWDTYCVLKSQWPYGHSAWTGIDPAAPRETRYVTKYLAKSALARVRASARYGRL